MINIYQLINIILAKLCEIIVKSLQIFNKKIIQQLIQ